MKRERERERESDGGGEEIRLTCAQADGPPWLWALVLAPCVACVLVCLCACVLVCSDHICYTLLVIREYMLLLTRTVSSLL